MRCTVYITRDAYKRYTAADTPEAAIDAFRLTYGVAAQKGAETVAVNATIPDVLVRTRVDGRRKVPTYSDLIEKK